MNVLGLWLWTAGLLGCKPGINPPDPPPQETGETQETDTDTGPAVVTACEVNEAEPNNSGQEASSATLEVVNCGAFADAGDGDFWELTVPEQGWLSVEVDAKRLGSDADVAIILSKDAVSVNQTDRFSSETTDVALVVPVTSGVWSINLREENLGHGESYFYEMLPSVVKPPLSWDRTEVEPSQSLSDAQLMAAGEFVFGTLQDLADVDWYRIDLPSGRQDLVVEVVAEAEGSPLNAALRVVDATGNIPAGCLDECVFESGRLGYEPDPVAELTVEGPQTLFVAVEASFSTYSPLHWYVVSASTEAP